jgi:elongation factor P--beta-lysine ligase
MHALWQRHIVRRAVRSYLDCAGFIEIDSPLLVHGSTPDAAIDSFAVMDRYLVTSTEYQIKRLEVGGFDRTYTLTQNYRFADHEGQFRNPEFTMLEWARVGQDLAMIEKDAEQMTWAAHLALGGSGQLSFSGHMIDLRPPWARMTVAEAIERFAGAALPDFSLSSILNAVQIAGITIDSASAHDIYFLFSLLMDHIQNQLGLTKPVFVTDWPAFETSSAREKSEGAIAERSEMFIAGIEISDGFPSLTDYDAQKRSFARQNARRHADGKAEVVVDDKYMESLRVGLPRGAGMALGFDRLVMVLTNRSSIRDVLAFAWDEV